MNLKDLTLVCLTLNRHDRVIKQLNYFANKPIDIIIADGSKKKWQFSNQGFKGAMNWRYFNYSHLNNNSKNYIIRWLRASKMIRTKYAMMLDDSDIYYWSGIKKTLSFLKSNKSYKVATGISAIGYITNNKLFCISQTSPKQILNFDNSSSTKRLSYMINNQFSGNIFYSIIEANLFKEVIKKTCDTKLSLDVMYELKFCSLLLIKSKFKFLTVPFHLRMVIPKLFKCQKDNIEKNNVNYWIKNKKKEFIEYKNYLIKSLTTQKVNLIDANLCINNFFKTYIKHYNFKFKAKQSFLDLILGKKLSLHIKPKIQKIFDYFFDKPIENEFFWKKVFGINLNSNQKKDLQKVTDFFCKYSNGVKQIKS